METDAAGLDFLWWASLTVLDPGKRIFWASLLSSLLLIVCLSGQNRWQNLKDLFSWKVWWHPSSRADFLIIGFNSLLRYLLLPGSWLGTAAFAALISWLLTKAIGTKPELSWSPLLVMSLYTGAVFVFDDFARFYLHTLQHRWRFLWVFHQVHHSASVLTPLTLYRTHPLEILQARLRNILSYGLVTGIFFYLFGQAVSGWDILGVNALGFLFNLAGANLRHSQIWIHFRGLEPWIISPAAHQLHHSRDPKHFDKNFGVCLAVWDRLWGTHVDPRDCHQRIQFGLDASPLSDPKKQNIWTLYAQPFKDFFSSSSHDSHSTGAACCAPQVNPYPLEKVNV